MRIGARGLARRRLPVPIVFHHQIYELHEMLTYLPHSNTLNTRVDTLEHHREQIRGECSISKSGGLAKANDTLVFSDLVLLDDPPRRMVRIGQLGESVPEGGSTLFHLAKLSRDSAAPVLKLALRIPAVLGAEIPPFLLFVGDYSLHPFRDQLVLRVEVAVKRHLVGLRCLGDRLDSNAANAVFVEKISSRNQNPLADRNPRARLLLAIAVNICLHDSFYPYLTEMLPIGNIEVLTACYRSVTYYMSVRSATGFRRCGPMQWSLAS